MTKFLASALLASAMLQSAEVPARQFQTHQTYYEVVDVPGFPGEHCVSVSHSPYGGPDALSCFYDINHQVGAK